MRRFSPVRRSCGADRRRRTDDADVTTEVVVPHVVENPRLRQHGAGIDHGRSSGSNVNSVGDNGTNSPFFHTRGSWSPSSMSEKTIACRALRRVGEAGPSQHYLQAGHDFFEEAERFGDVVVAADGETVDLVGHRVAGREEKRRCRDAVVAQSLEQPKPSIPGIITSSTSRSGRLVRQMSSARARLPRSPRRTPGTSATRDSSDVLLSSTTRTRASLRRGHGLQCGPLMRWACQSAGENAGSDVTVYPPAAPDRGRCRAGTVEGRTIDEFLAALAQGARSTRAGTSQRTSSIPLSPSGRQPPTTRPRHHAAPPLPLESNSWPLQVAEVEVAVPGGPSSSGPIPAAG